MWGLNSSSRQSFIHWLFGRMSKKGIETRTRHRKTDVLGNGMAFTESEGYVCMCLGNELCMVVSDAI